MPYGPHYLEAGILRQEASAQSQREEPHRAAYNAYAHTRFLSGGRGGPEGTGRFGCGSLPASNTSINDDVVQ